MQTYTNSRHRGKIVTKKIIHINYTWEQYIGGDEGNNEFLYVSVVNVSQDKFVLFV